MRTVISIDTIQKSARVLGDRTTETVTEHDSHLTEDEVFAKVYPDLAKLGHDHSSRVGWCGYSYKYT